MHCVLLLAHTTASSSSCDVLVLIKARVFKDSWVGKKNHQVSQACITVALRGLRNSPSSLEAERATDFY